MSSNVLLYVYTSHTLCKVFCYSLLVIGLKKENTYHQAQEWKK